MPEIANASDRVVDLGGRNKGRTGDLPRSVDEGNRSLLPELEVSEGSRPAASQCLPKSAAGQFKVMLNEFGAVFPDSTSARTRSNPASASPLVICSLILKTSRGVPTRNGSPGSTSTIIHLPPPMPLSASDGNAVKRIWRPSALHIPAIPPLVEI